MDLDVRGPDPREVRPRRLGHLGQPLDRDHAFAEEGEDCGLVPRTGSDLEHPVPGSGLEHRRHLRDDVGLGDRLARPDRQGHIVVGGPFVPARDEEVAGDAPHRLEHPLVVDSPGRDLVRDHGVAHGLVRILHS